jgi:hypothetical protein
MIFEFHLTVSAVAWEAAASSYTLEDYRPLYSTIRSSAHVMMVTDLLPPLGEKS